MASLCPKKTCESGAGGRGMQDVGVGCGVWDVKGGVWCAAIGHILQTGVDFFLCRAHWSYPPPSPPSPLFSTSHFHPFPPVIPHPQISSFISSHLPNPPVSPKTHPRTHNPHSCPVQQRRHSPFQYPARATLDNCTCKIFMFGPDICVVVYCLPCFNCSCPVGDTDDDISCSKILLPSARHLQERVTFSQSVSQSGKSQSGSQLGKQAGKQKHTVWLFSVVDHSYKQ